MNFLAPLFMLGALTVALPVIFHLIRRTTRERTPFSSLMFLMPTPPRLTRRSRLEHILLLALRCAVLCLLALGFARPFLSRPVASDPAAPAKRVVVLVDTSASMRRANLWSDARDKAESILRKAAPADEVALFTFDRQLNPLVTFEQWNTTPHAERAGLAMGKLAQASPGWLGTHAGQALIGAAEVLADTTRRPLSAPGEIVLISDLQEGSRLEPLQGYEWPKGIKVTVEPLKARHTSNAALQLATDSGDADPKAGPDVRVRISNAALSKREQFKVGWARADGSGMAGKPIEIYVPPGQSRIVPVPVVSSEAAVDRILLQGDEEDFDNTVFVTPPEVARLGVLYLGTDSEKDPKQMLYFMQRAFRETRRQVVQLTARQPGTALPANELDGATLVVVADPLPEQRAAALHDQAAAGRTIFVALKSAAAAQTLARLLAVDRIGAEEARPASYAMLAEIDFRHPLFAPFADPRFSDFTKIHFWNYRRLDAEGIPGARTVARFDSGAPAILVVPVGKGRVVVLTSGWHPEDSQLALSTKFVPLLYSLLDYSGAPPPAPVQYQVGDVVPIPSVETTRSLVVRTPGGAELTLPATETNFSRTTAPGIYTVTSVQPSRRFVVNLDAAESRTASLPVEELERLGVPVLRQVTSVERQVERKVRLQNAELEDRQKLWRWVILAALGVLLVETWLAGRATRRVAVPGGGSS